MGRQQAEEKGWQKGESIDENWHALLENIKMHEKQNLEEA